MASCRRKTSTSDADRTYMLPTCLCKTSTSDADRTYMPPTCLCKTSTSDADRTYMLPTCLRQPGLFPRKRHSIRKHYVWLNMFIRSHHNVVFRYSFCMNNLSLSSAYLTPLTCQRWKYLKVCISSASILRVSYMHALFTLVAAYMFYITAVTYSPLRIGL